MPFSRTVANVLKFRNLSECRGNVELLSTVVKVIEKEYNRLNLFPGQDPSSYANDIV